MQLSALLLTSLLFVPATQDEAVAEPAAVPGEVFDQVVSMLERWYYDKEFRVETLPGLAAPYRDQAWAAETLVAERAVVGQFLAEIPSSHLALLSIESYHRLGAELFGKSTPRFGLQLVHLEGRYHATWILEGGPADIAGVRRGDEVVTIDGLLPAACTRLDWSTDDAALPDAPVHALNAEEGDVVEIQLRRERDSDETFTVELTAVPYSGWEASDASVRVIEQGDERIGYVHFWFFQFDKPSTLMRSLIEGRFSECDGLVVDLRGRGGSALEVERLMRLFDLESGVWGRPLVALTDRRTRSAKEVIALRIQEENVGALIGERTAGAVIPATFKEVGGGAVLMFPSATIGQFSDRLEGKGVAPDVAVDDPVPFIAGADPILEAALRHLRSRLVSESASSEAADR